MLSSSSSLKNKEVLIYLDGGKIEGSGSSFLESFMEAIVSLEHGTCLCLVLQLGNLLVSESYQFHVSLYFFIPVEECSYCHHIMFLVLVESMFPSQLSCLIMFKGSFTSNHPSVVLPVSISYVSPYSFDPPSYITFLCQFVSMMGDTSRPSFDEYFPVDFNTLSGN
jgi:hypothetical protein